MRAESAEARRLLRNGQVGDWQNYFSSEFGQFFIDVANERLSLGETTVTNTTASTWDTKAGEVTAAATQSY